MLKIALYLGETLRLALQEQYKSQLVDVNTYFGPIRTPVLEDIFGRRRARYCKRTSSAQWSSPMANPKQGTSRLHDLGAKKH